MKKLISMLLVLVMICSMATVAFAATLPEWETKTNGVVNTSGSITINGTHAGNDYSIYKLLHLESYNKDTGKYSYKISTGWEGFFASDDAKVYITVSDDGYVTWNQGKEDADSVATFAQLAMAYAKAHKDTISAIASSKATGTTVTFSNLTLGYYLIDSTMGALCGLTTTNPAASVNAKNAAPTIDKQVNEDSTGQWTEWNTADIGQTVEFRVTINVHAGAENYVLHDQMSAGLTFQQVSKIQHVIPDVSVTDVPASYYTVVTNGLTDGCTFEIRFTQEFCDHLSTNDKVLIFYEAILNSDAVVGDAGNPNEAYLEYGEDHKTTHDQTTTKTYGVEIIKTDSQFTLIDGAAFRIYDAAEGGNEIPVVWNAEDGCYHRTYGVTTGENIVVKDGRVKVLGLDNGTYYLEEVVVPAGYNKLSARHKFIISDDNLFATFNGDIYSTGSGVHVVNKNGTMLPETGSTGTFMFVSFGTFMVLAAGVLLVTKKRMGMIQE